MLYVDFKLVSYVHAAKAATCIYFVTCWHYPVTGLLLRRRRLLLNAMQMRINKRSHSSSTSNPFFRQSTIQPTNQQFNVASRLLAKNVKQFRKYSEQKRNVEMILYNIRYIKNV